MNEPKSVSAWIADLKVRDEVAAQKLWQRYSARLTSLARHLLKDAPKRVSDEEDIASTVFHTLCRGAAAGRFQDVKNRDDLWWLLLAMTKQKVVDHIRRETAQKRGGGTNPKNSRDSLENRDFSLDQLISEEPTPQLVFMLQEEHRRLLSMLEDDCSRQIAVFRIEGLTIPEIANELQMSTRSIERKLNSIRRIWLLELQMYEMEREC
jgi:RNA polymerase sigma factor (sigma-70 family)